MMIWEGIEILPVTTTNKKILGVITREDVLKSMQLLDGNHKLVRQSTTNC